MHDIQRRFFPVQLLAGLILTVLPAIADTTGEITPTFVRSHNDAIARGEVSHADHPCALGKMARYRNLVEEGRNLAGLGDSWSEVSEDDTTHAYNTQHLDIQLWPDIGSMSFAGEVELTAVANQSLSSFIVHLKLATVSEVGLNGNPVPYDHVGEQITITPDSPIGSEDEFTVRIVYDGTIFNNNFDGGMVYHTGTNTLYTFGEPYDIRRFIACYDYPFDKVTSRMRVTLPEEYDVASNGVLQEVIDNGDGTRTHDWLNLEPTSTYLLAFSAAPYIVLADDNAGVNDIPVNYWVYPSMQDEAWIDFNRTDEMVDYFEPLFGPYPFVKYDQAMAPIFNGWGAMEHQTSTTYGENLIDGSRQFEHIVAHELGHQWWGDMVGPRTFANIWLNEGFASYSEALWAENFGEFNRMIHLDGFRQQYFAEDQNLRYPLYDPPPSRLFGTTIYKKGAWVLHMLRWVVGDDDFFDGLIQYGENHQYQTAAVPDFEAVMEDVSGMDLTAFFDEWVYQAGYPEYDFSNFVVMPEGDSWTMYLSVMQTQQNAPYFSTPLPIRIEGAGGESAMIRVNVQPVESQTVVVPDLDFEPVAYQFDPDQWILCQFDVAGVGEPSGTTPGVFELSQAWPNPFNDGAAVRLTLARPSDVTARVYDMLGREVAVLTQQAYTPGTHRLTWQPEPGRASGSYMLRVQAGTQTELRRLTLLR